MSDDVRLQLLLRPQWRSEKGAARVRDILKSLGLKPTTAGRASLSARCTRSVFESVFGVAPRESPPATPEPAPFPSTQEVPVPDALSEYVESLTVAPPHQRF